MNDLDAIIKQAFELGRKISEHPRTKDFLVAAKAVSDDAEAQGVLKEYQDAINAIRALESAGKPVEPEHKHRAADAERKVAGNSKLKEMMKHQANYLEMMHKINSAIDESAQGEMKQ